MIPLQLQIKNFLSYGSDIQTIDFSTYHLMCLSGKNGHGKSALLDAMTWAVWGQARKANTTSRADLGLLRLGQLQMLVVFDFIFNSATYRVRREFSYYYNKPHVNLDFGLLDETTQERISLTEKTIRGTQEKIDALLNLDYDAFINSAFLRQGGSNEFSKKSPRERKQVLASILGLDHYEQLRKRASDKAKETIIHKSLLTSLYEKNNQELVNHAQVKVRRATIIDELTELTKQEKACTGVYTQVLEQKKVYLQEHQKASMLIFQNEQIATQEDHTLSLIRTTRTTWRTLAAKLRTINQQTNLYAAREKIAADITKIQTNMQRHVQLKEQLLSAKEIVHKIRLDISEQTQKEHNEYRFALQRATAEINACQQALVEHTSRHADLEKEYAVTQQTIQTLEADSALHAQLPLELERIERQFEKRRTYYQVWITEGNWLSAEQKGVYDKQKLVQDDTNPSCPLCQQTLSVSRKRFLKQTFEYRERYLGHRIARLHTSVQTLKKLLYEQHAVVVDLKQKLDEQTRIKAQITELKNNRDKQMAALDISINSSVLLHLKKLEFETSVQAAHAHLERASQEHTTRMDENQAYVKALQALQTTEAALTSCVYDAAQHASLLEQLQHIDSSITDTALMSELQATKHQQALTLRGLCETVRTLRAQQRVYAAQLETYAQLTHHSAELEKQETALSLQLQEYADIKNRLLEEKGRLDKEHETYIRLEQEMGNQKIAIDAYEKDIVDYQAIAHATSKEGIQALLIEDAIPEIEHEANQLLARLTNNQAQIFIESLRDLKKGGTKETLDIKISDAVGIRPYELFSGGEAFRIDFALRIALSKLLARRAGTSLQTLIIDEGFGSQDEEGLSNIMEAIYKIQDDFAKIIIVSHLDVMKNQFPVHLHVEKGANGSRVQVIEQG